MQCGMYTLDLEKCPYCGGGVRVPHPAKFSPQDKYAKYRRAMKAEVMEEAEHHGKDVRQGNPQD